MEEHNKVSYHKKIPFSDPRPVDLQVTSNGELEALVHELRNTYWLFGLTSAMCFSRLQATTDPKISEM